MNQFTDTKLGKSLSYLGVVIGLVGMTHGIPELLQGESFVISNSINAFPENWPNAYMFELLQGQPAVSILTGIPFQMLGILAILVSSALIIFSAFFPNSKHSLIVFAILNTAVLFFGAGGGNPVLIGLPTIIAVWIFRTFGKKKKRTDASDALNLKLFRVFLSAHIISWLLLFPGIFILDGLGVKPDPLFYLGVMTMIISVPGTLISAYRYDTTLRAA
ncbi:MAG: hypothetical protein AAF570_16545 [Bacteroidota bacterium]